MSYDAQIPATTDTSVNYNSSTPQQSNVEAEETSCFSSNTPEPSSTPSDTNSADLKTLEEAKRQEEIEYWQNYAKQAKKVAETAQKHTESLEKVGVLGMVANLFTGGADKVTDEINQLDGNSTDEEIQAAEESIKEREATEDLIVGTEVALLAAATGGAAIGIAGGAAAIGYGTAAALGGSVGAAGGIYAHQLDHATNQVKGDTFQDVEEVLNDGAKGLVAGAAAPITQAIAGKVGAAVGAGLGLEEGVILAADGTANVGATTGVTALANGAGQAVGSATVAGLGYVADVATDKDKEFSGEDMAKSVAIGGAIGFGLGAATGAVQGRATANAFNEALRAANPYNISRMATAEEVGKLADKEIGDKEYRIATAGYSAPPEGYEESTKEFLGQLDKQLGTKKTAYITSPTADKGSIDAITTEITGMEKGKIFYTTAEGYVKYINPENFPDTIDTEAYSKLAKHVLPNGAEYSRATAEASNTFLATGGRNATVSDFVNATTKGNKAVVLNNSSVQTPAWGEAKGRVENASKYISEQLSAFFSGKELPYPEVEGFTKEFMTQNSDKLKDLVQVVTTDGSSSSVQEAASQAARFIKSSLGRAELETAWYELEGASLLHGFSENINSNLTKLWTSGTVNKEQFINICHLDFGMDTRNINDFISNIH